MRRRRRARRHSLEVAPRLLRGCYHQTPRRAAPAAASRRFYPLGRPSVVTAATTEPTAAASSSLSAQPPSIVSLCFSLSLLRSPIPHKIGRLGKREATARRTCGTPRRRHRPAACAFYAAAICPRPDLAKATVAALLPIAVAVPPPSCHRSTATVPTPPYRRRRRSTANATVVCSLM